MPEQNSLLGNSDNYSVNGASIKQPDHPPATKVTEKTSLVAQGQKSLQQCLAEVDGSDAENRKDGITNFLANIGQTHTALDAATERLVGADALSLGRAFSGNRAGGTIPANSQARFVGTQIKSGLEAASPYLKGTGVLLSGLSVMDGYRTNGVSGLMYSLVDAAIETTMSSSIVGAGVAVAYDRYGGTRKVTNLVNKSYRAKACMVAAGYASWDD